MATMYPFDPSAVEYVSGVGETTLRVELAGASGGDAAPVGLRHLSETPITAITATSAPALPIPAGVLPGDLLLLVASEGWNPSTHSPAEVTVPPGWAPMGSTGPAFATSGTVARRSRLWSKVAATSESAVVVSSTAGSPAFGGTLTNVTQFLLMAFRPPDGASPSVTAGPVFFSGFGATNGASFVGTPVQPGSGSHLVFTVIAGGGSSADEAEDTWITATDSRNQLSVVRSFGGAVPDRTFSVPVAGEVKGMSFALDATPTHFPLGGRGSLIVAEFVTEPGQSWLVSPGSAGGHGALNGAVGGALGEPSVATGLIRVTGGFGANGGGGGGAPSRILKRVGSSWVLAAIAGGGGGAGSAFAPITTLPHGGDGGGSPAGGGLPVSGSTTGGTGGANTAGGVGGTGVGWNGLSGTAPGQQTVPQGASGGHASSGSSSVVARLRRFRGGGGGGGGRGSGGGGGSGRYNYDPTSFGGGGGGGSDWVNPDFGVIVASYPGSNLGDGWIKISEGRRNITNRSRRLIPATRRTITLR